MKDEKISELAWQRYASAIKSGKFSPYDCARFVEQSYNYDGDDRLEIMKTAILALARHDPFFFATSPHGSPEVTPTVEELKSCVSQWSLSDDHLAALLEGHFIMSFIYRTDADRAVVEHAISVLERAEPAFRNDVSFLELYARALEIIGDDRFAAVIDSVIAKTDPERRAHPLRDAIDHAVEKANWTRYDLLRNQWEALPRNASICECHTNFVANIDGLRALERGDQEAAI